MYVSIKIADMFGYGYNLIRKTMTLFSCYIDFNYLIEFCFYLSFEDYLIYAVFLQTFVGKMRKLGSRKLGSRYFG